METEDFIEDPGRDEDDEIDSTDDEVEVTASNNYNPETTCLICFTEMEPDKLRSLGDKYELTVIDASKQRKDNKYEMIPKYVILKLTQII